MAAIRHNNMDTTKQSAFFSAQDTSQMGPDARTIPEEQREVSLCVPCFILTYQAKLYKYHSFGKSKTQYGSCQSRSCMALDYCFPNAPPHIYLSLYLSISTSTHQSLVVQMPITRCSDAELMCSLVTSCSHHAHNSRLLQSLWMAHFPSGYDNCHDTTLENDRCIRCVLLEWKDQDHRLLFVGQDRSSCSICP